ncbi:MAG: hypothetical protein L0323_10075 [Planctomycetes bacterium]|nr:hypothetical protein [Planctomycetota bacterium]
MWRTSRVAFGAALAFSSSSPLASAQLPPGTFLAVTSSGPTVNPTANSVQVVDPFAGTATPISIAGLPTGAGSSYSYSAPAFESPTSFLLGTGSAAPSSRNLYRVTWSSGSGWSATQLNAGTFSQIVYVAQIAILPSGIYVVGNPTGGAGGLGAYVYSLPTNGGAPSLYADLTAAGAQGLGNGMTAVGTSLHVFTADTTTTGPNAKHWEVDTTTVPPTITFRGALPDSLVPSTPSQNFGSAQAAWDPVSGNIVLAGVRGDVLRRTPSGTNVNQILSPGVCNGTPGAIPRHDGLAINLNTNAIGLGDGCAHYDELRCDATLFLDDLVTMPPPVPSVSLFRLSYVTSAANYLEDGEGCAGSNGLVPCNYVNSLPTGGNASFAITLANALPSTAAFLVIGISDTAWGPFALPLPLAGFGAPGCSLRVSLDIPFLGVTGASGEASAAFPIPAGLTGTAYSQWIVSDPAANGLGLAFSDGRRIDIG